VAGGRIDKPSVHVGPGRVAPLCKNPLENFFKYIKAEYLIDALADYQIEPDDPHRSVPNPARKALEKEMRRTRSQLEKLRARYAEATLGPPSRRRDRCKTKEEREGLRGMIKQVQGRLKKLQTQHRSLAPRLPLAQARQGEAVVKLATDRKHLTNVLKMVAYNIESDLVQLIRPHYSARKMKDAPLFRARYRMPRISNQPRVSYTSA
jgi:septal ring factor EnvC (AmiA/AmiB activator)